MTVTWFGLQTYVRGDLILETTQNQVDRFLLCKIL